MHALIKERNENPSADRTSSQDQTVATLLQYNPPEPMEQLEYSTSVQGQSAKLTPATRYANVHDGLDPVI